MNKNANYLARIQTFSQDPWSIEFDLNHRVHQAIIFLIEMFIINDLGAIGRPIGKAVGPTQRSHPHSYTDISHE